MGHRPILSVRGLSKSFGALKAVDDVSFAVSEGEIVGFCGPNGAGKTTLFDLVCGLTTTDGGHVAIGEQALPAGRPDIRVRWGLARTFQLNAAFTSLSVWDNLFVSFHFGRRARRTENGKAGFEVREIEALAARLDLDAVLDRRADEISTLQSKLLMLACALASDPRFVLLDEPVGGLSQAEIEAFRTTLLDLSRERGVTFLIIEHVMHFLMSVSSRMIFLHRGRIEFDGKPYDLAQDSKIVALYLGNTAAQLIRENG